ncbi:MAG: hypothetical protein LBT30_04930 [Clostridiales bacterium]|jgi:hypothetical protein|nr:hypothetical protein [Clostridiales bacterium]
MNVSILAKCQSGCCVVTVNSFELYENMIMANSVMRDVGSNGKSKKCNVRSFVWLGCYNTPERAKEVFDDFYSYVESVRSYIGDSFVGLGIPVIFEFPED